MISRSATSDKNLVNARWSSQKAKGAKPTFIDALAGRTGILTHDDDEDFKKTTTIKRKAGSKKRQGKNQPRDEQKNKRKYQKKSDSPAISTSGNFFVEMLER